MAGIYFHIPFCKQACNYCDFHFATTLRQKQPLIEALSMELHLRKNYLKDSAVSTVYFGGGTPSILDREEIELLLKEVRTLYSVSADAEITLEANPDDLSTAKLEAWKQIGINRLSIGIQSFRQADLEYMNRSHNEEEAVEAVERARKAGFENISIDLIYGLPFSSDDQWQSNLEQALALNVPHISAYGLTIEPQTNFGYLHRKGKLKELPDEVVNRQFELLITALNNAGYEHYEISNFAKPGRYSKHNSSYWKGTPYLGIGPSAHGFNGKERYMNVANNKKYVEEITGNRLPETIEVLTLSDQYNDYILTRLRTSAGIDLNEVQTQFGDEMHRYLLAEARLPVDEGLLHSSEDSLRLSHQGKFLADHVCAQLFHTNENE
jgi:oxygen-independent coproporphyrinogen-3 oxidase